MEKRDIFTEIKNLLSQLTDEHKKLLKEGEYIRAKLEEGVNTDTLEEIENFLSEVNKHAYVEENDLDNLINKAGITEFDTEALNFGHRTLEEIGKELNVTRERVRQIESSAIKKLKHPKVGRKLKNYIEE